MILYLDASALVRRYVAEHGTSEVAEAIAAAEIVGTSLLSQAETAAALAKAVRTGVLTRQEASSVLQVFRSEWANFVRVQATELLVVRADELAWELGLRGYDAVHLASARLWQDGMGQLVTLATVDRQLWQAAERRGLAVLPDDLPERLETWS
jgi:predicted nucleic acid-binding protein